MKKLIAAGLLSLAVGLGGAVSVASAQDMTPAVKSGPPSVDWPIADLLTDTGAHAVLAKDLPKLLTYDGLDGIKQMSIRNISKFPQAEIDDAKLAAIQTDLAALAPAAPMTK
jgi:hypothetical protein